MSIPGLLYVSLLCFLLPLVLVWQESFHLISEDNHTISFYILWLLHYKVWVCIFNWVWHLWFCLANVCWRFSWLPLFKRYQFPLQVVWSRSTILNCVGRHFLCRLLEFLFLISLMLTCFPGYFSVYCLLLLLKLFSSLCLLLHLIGNPDMYILSNLFVHFFWWYILLILFCLLVGFSC